MFQQELTGYLLNTDDHDFWKPKESLLLRIYIFVAVTKQRSNQLYEKKKLGK